MFNMTSKPGVTSFQKKAKSNVPSVPGSKLSVQNAQLLVSSGVPSLDHVIGGGIPVGTIVLVEEDTYGSYSKILLKYFLSEGVTCGHSLLVSSQDRNVEKLVQELPAVADGDQPDLTSRPAVPETEMTIAWRYKNLKTVQSSPTGSSFGHHFDLTKTMDETTLSKTDIHYWNGSNRRFSKPDTDSLSKNSNFEDLILTIENQIDIGGYSVTGRKPGVTYPEERNVLRIVIDGLGSPLWCVDNESQNEMTMFLYNLRGLLRSAYAACVVTVPSHLFKDAALIKRCQHLCDTCVRLESFAGSDKETHPLFKDYHGLFHVTKLSAINTITCHVPESSDLAFKLRRKKFIIEKLHLPPELQETAQREQDDMFAVPSSSGCGGTGSAKNLLDF